MKDLEPFSSDEHDSLEGTEARAAIRDPLQPMKTPNPLRQRNQKKADTCLISNLVESKKVGKITGYLFCLEFIAYICFVTVKQHY